MKGSTMRLLAMLAASCFLTLGALQADAAVVTFQGTLLTGGGGTAIFGTIPPDPARNFTLQLNYNPGTAPTNFLAPITGGTFNVAPGTNFAVTGGSIIVTDGANDNASFTVNVSGPAAGTLTFSFDGNSIPTNDASEANVNAMVAGDTTNLLANFGAAGVYVGTITGDPVVTAVPEPGSCLALLGLVGGGAWRWRRSRQQRNAA